MSDINDEFRKADNLVRDCMNEYITQYDEVPKKIILSDYEELQSLAMWAALTYGLCVERTPKKGSYCE